MQLKSGLPYSLIRFGLVHDYPKLEKNLVTDVVVMGAGISGAMMAYQLTKDNIPHIVVDARSVGLGSTCASTSLLQYELDLSLADLSGMIGKEKAVSVYCCCRAALYKTLDWAKELGSKDAEHMKSLYYSAVPSQKEFLVKEFQARKEAGFDVELYSRQDLKKLAGISASAGILSNDGGQVDSYLFTHAMHQHNISKGHAVYDRSPVTKIDHGRSAVKLVTANGYSIRAKHLVYACGYEATRYVDEPIVKLNTTFVVASETISGAQSFLPKDLLIWNTADPYLYMRSTSDRRILVGGRDLPYSKAVESNIILEKRKRLLLGDFKKLYPSIPFIPEFSWSGVFASTKDSLPYIGKYKKLKHGYFALGYGGNGIVFSRVAAELIASMIQGKKHENAGLFSFER